MDTQRQKVALINPRKGNHYTGRRCMAPGCACSIPPFASIAASMSLHHHLCARVLFICPCAIYKCVRIYRCDGYLFDSTIDFGDNLPSEHIKRGTYNQHKLDNMHKTPNREP